jgi:arsenate reductase-like glutaredoxin family protein
MSRRPLTQAEVRALVGERDVAPFLNTRNELYRERGMNSDPPGKDEAIRLMAENPNLIRRPLFVDGREIVFGFDEEAYRMVLHGQT